MKFTWLHVSDFHVRGGDPYDRDAVLRALVRAVGDYRRGSQALAPDAIFATGDIAHSGKPSEYAIAGAFFDDLLRAADLDKSRLWVIPGNHDVDRDLGVGLARTLASREEADSYFRPELPKPHLTQKMSAYLRWYDTYFSGVRKAVQNSTCGTVDLIELNDCRIAILPINTALFCHDDSDHGKLWVGRRCLSAVLGEFDKTSADLKIALLHHPLEWLHPVEGANIQADLEASADILLRGHLHETRLEYVASGEGELLRCAAGAAYQTRQWPNRALYGSFDNGQVTIFPIAYVDSPQEIWTTDPSVFPRAPGHKKTFPVRQQQQSVAETPSAVSTLRTFRSNVATRGNRPFVGRDDLIAELDSLFADSSTECVVVLHGAPGVGKTELAREFARLRRERYPGGTFVIDASTSAFGINLASLGQNILGLTFPADTKVR